MHFYKKHVLILGTYFQFKYYYSKIGFKFNSTLLILINYI